jgi:uncharacterized phage protein gp47/JayE
MKTVAQQKDFVTKDYEGFRQLMIDNISSLTPEWTDTSESDLGVVILESLAMGLDILSYYQDKAYNESSIDTAKMRKSVIKLCRLLGYELSAQTPAVHKIVFTKSDEYLTQSITIKKGTKLSTSSTLGNPIVFELNDEVVIPAGTASAFGYATHGETILDDILGVTSGKSGDKFKLNYADALVDTLIITINESGTDRIWTRVENFISSSPTDRHYNTSADEYNIITIGFGSGVSGMIPPANSLVSASYRQGGGTIGNVGINTITEFMDTEIAGVTLTNPEIPYIYGSDVEEIEHAKLVAPKFYRSIEKAVTAQDFEDLMLKQTGVSKCKCSESYNETGDVTLYIVPTDYSVLPDLLKGNLQTYANSITLVNCNPIIADPTYVDFDITAHLYLYPNYLSSAVIGQVEELLRSEFDKKYIEFGEDIYISNIYKLILSVEGIKNVTISLPTTDVAVSDLNVARLVNVTISSEGGVEG